MHIYMHAYVRVCVCRVSHRCRAPLIAANCCISIEIAQRIYEFRHSEDASFEERNSLRKEDNKISFLSEL